jgi:hypothetical protein
MQFFKRLAHKNEEVEQGALHKMYAALVNEKIRARYDQSAENAILRKAIAGLDMEEFNTFNAYAE